MVKYILEDKGFGKFKHKVPKPVSGKKIREAQDKGLSIYDSRKEAYDAISN